MMLYDELPCFPSCAVTTGTPIVVTDGATHTSIDFTLQQNFVRNSRFDDGTANWLFFATPDPSYIVANVVDGVLEYYRVPPPPGTANQAVAFQETTVAVAPSDATLLAQFDLGNSSSVRKRISVLVLDSNFSDLSVCTFFPGPECANAHVPDEDALRLRRGPMRPSISTLRRPAAMAAPISWTTSRCRQRPLQSATRTDCVDPTAPVPPGGPDEPNLLVNGNFDTGTQAPWIAFGTITSAGSGGVFEFVRPNATPPAGVVLQPTSRKR